MDKDTRRDGSPKIVQPEPTPKAEDKPQTVQDKITAVKGLLAYEARQAAGVPVPEGVGDATFVAVQGIDYHLHRMDTCRRVLAFLEEG